MSEEIVAPGVTCELKNAVNSVGEYVQIKVYVSHPSNPSREIYLYVDDMDAVCDWWTKKRQERAGGDGYESV